MLQAMATDTVFATPWRDRSGPLLAGPQPYGELTSEGEWDGEGAWWAPMPLPASSTGERGWVSARPWQPISAGWLVTKSSPRAGDALMVLDTLLGEPAAESRKRRGLIPVFGPDEVVIADALRGLRRGQHQLPVAQVGAGENGRRQSHPQPVDRRLSRGR